MSHSAVLDTGRIVYLYDKAIQRVVKRIRLTRVYSFQSVSDILPFGRVLELLSVGTSEALLRFFGLISSSLAVCHISVVTRPYAFKLIIAINFAQVYCNLQIMIMLKLVS